MGVSAIFWGHHFVTAHKKPISRNKIIKEHKTMRKLFLLLAIIASNYAAAYELGVGDLTPECKVIGRSLSIGNEIKRGECISGDYTRNNKLIKIRLIMQEDGYLTFYTYYPIQKGQHKANTTWKTVANTTAGDKAVYNAVDEFVVVNNFGIKVWFAEITENNYEHKYSGYTYGGYIYPDTGGLKIRIYEIGNPGESEKESHISTPDDKRSEIILSVDDNLPSGSWLSSCVYKSVYDGILSGVCVVNLRRVGMISTFLDYSNFCATDSSVSNVNGELQCAVWNDKFPSGNYSSSCIKPSFKSGILRATCPDRNGVTSRPFLNYKKYCAEGSSVTTNMNGELQCDKWNAIAQKMMHIPHSGWKIFH